jgi:hypothetical protein
MRAPRPYADLFASLAPLRAHLAAHDEDLLRTQVAVSEVAAPTGDEGERAAWLRDRFTALGLAGVRVDEVGDATRRWSSAPISTRSSHARRR